MAMEGVSLSRETRQLLDENNLSPLWEVEEQHLGKEREDLEPEIWHWETIDAAISGIASDVKIEELPPGFRRRVTVPVNPTYPASISHTIYVGVQTVSPGETAPSHRHGANAFRFAIDGHEEMKTVVAGEEFPMLDNDLVTTPQWEWHDHTNDSDQEAAWLDVLDLPLVFNSLNVGNEFEEHEDERQPVTKPQGYHASKYGPLRSHEEREEIPGPFTGTQQPTAPYRFQWANCQTALDNAGEHDAAARDPYDGVVMDYANPVTGSRPLFPTFDVRAQVVDETTDAHSHNATEVYHVVEGSGATHVDGTTLAWSDRDVFVVPPNAPHHHDPDGDATLLSISDRPILESINFYYETEA